MVKASDKIVVAGAGSIGCYVGGCLALAGRDVTLFGRVEPMEKIARCGLRISDLDGRDQMLGQSEVKATNDAGSAMHDARFVLVAVKSAATEEMAGLIDRFAPPEAIVVSLQNGVRNAGRLRAAMSVPRTVMAGMVPFNVVLDQRGEQLHSHKATEGTTLIEVGAPELVKVLNVEGCAIAEVGDVQSVLWGKLLLNLNNALNALSGLPLAQELSDRRWRSLLATQMDEALKVMRTVGIRPAKLTASPPRLLPTILRLPDWLFLRVAKRMLAIDPHARSSMWDDLQAGRPTEIAEFQGIIAELAWANKIATPLTDKVIALIAKAERESRGSPALTPDGVRP